MKLGHLGFPRNQIGHEFRRTKLAALALTIILGGLLGPTIAAADDPPPTCQPGTVCPDEWPWSH